MGFKLVSMCLAWGGLQVSLSLWLALLGEVAVAACPPLSAVPGLLTPCTPLPPPPRSPPGSGCIAL